MLQSYVVNLEFLLLESRPLGTWLGSSCIELSLQDLTLTNSSREWLELLLQRLYNPASGLFVKDEGTGNLRIDPASSSKPDIFRFIGRIHSLAIFHGFLIDPQLVPLIYPILLSSPGKSSDQTALLKSVGKAVK